MNFIPRKINVVILSILMLVCNSLLILYQRISEPISTGNKQMLTTLVSNEKFQSSILDSYTPTKEKNLEFFVHKKMEDVPDYILENYRLPESILDPIKSDMGFGKKIETNVQRMYNISFISGGRFYNYKIIWIFWDKDWDLDQYMTVKRIEENIILHTIQAFKNRPDENHINRSSGNEGYIEYKKNLKNKTEYDDNTDKESNKTDENYHNLIFFRYLLKHFKWFMRLKNKEDELPKEYYPSDKDAYKKMVFPLEGHGTVFIASVYGTFIAEDYFRIKTDIKKYQLYHN
ncbi:hypothetical protein EDEG_00408 [Edhazardia aedis USNM 41457]|uniref:Uncharacterized protein n=1 Tax=Edhazardia aedis (strain USNM 41457) TaxID=1003232 RepID=J8ZPJ2_EDHAE|nr:hypothetical protein EDEG_00408 [Edhazardia aedis USNM 41457]|eukprot:EJW01593.1 hypothetical protein EDEG_00408 [Edhazardia aedis USNM 41457]